MACGASQLATRAIGAYASVREQFGQVLVDDCEVAELGPGGTGELALRPGWPSMFRTYLGEQERYERCFVGGWYLTGDLARRDEDGYFWFVGRGDDVIKSAGHLIGPFEVESALMEHPAVAEAGVIGKPDPIAGEVVKAFVTLRPGFEPSEAPPNRMKCAPRSAWKLRTRTKCCWRRRPARPIEIGWRSSAAWYWLR